MHRCSFKSDIYFTDSSIGSYKSISYKAENIEKTNYKHIIS